MMKKLLRHPLAVRLVAALIAGYGKFVFLTSRIQILGPIPPEVAQGPVIFALWHQNIFAVPLLRRHHPYKLIGLMSASRDGTLTRTIAPHFGIGSVTGSSSKGAVNATRNLIRAIRAGQSLFLTPDGPRGPARKAKQGTTEIARLTKLPVIPVAAWPIKGHTFASWDSFRMPYPFTTIVLIYGNPLPANTVESLENALTTLTDEAEAAAATLATKARNA